MMLSMLLLFLAGRGWGRREEGYVDVAAGGAMFCCKDTPRGEGRGLSGQGYMRGSSRRVLCCCGCWDVCI